MKKITGTLMKKIKYAMIISLIIVSLAIAALWPLRHSAMLLSASIFNRVPSSSHCTRIRNHLLAQEKFQQMLAVHEKKTLKRFRQGHENSYEKKYLHRTSTSMFGVASFYDVWETWVRTDIVGGEPKTSFLVRLGIIKDKNAGPFFSRQRKGIKGKTIMFFAAAYNKMYDIGLLHPYRLNITEMDETSSMSRVRISREKWSDMSKRVHLQGKGKTFLTEVI